MRIRSTRFLRPFVVVVFALSILTIPARVLAACGATERWFVKVATDPDASLVNVNQVVPITVTGLNQLPHLQNTVPHGDNKFRLPQERVVYQVSGRLMMFKDEEDNDYHLVITDDSLNFTPGGEKSTGLETGTSFIAEIPHPDCVAGKHGDPNVPSRFATQLRDVRQKFEARFPNGKGADQNLGGIPVTLTGVAFYDRPHNQTGRAINGIELHPLLDIQFNDAPAPLTVPPGVPPVVAQLIANPGFEDGVTGWHGTLRDIGSFDGLQPRGGNNLVWMGGWGSAHTESLYQNVSIPASAQSVKLAFWLRVDTAETTTTAAHDKLFVQLRDTDGHVLKTLVTYSNLDRTNGYEQKSFDVSEHKGNAVQVYFRAVEDNGKQTSFVLDDITLTVQ